MLARQLRSKGSIPATLRRTLASTAQRNSPVATESAVTPPPSESSSSPNSYYKITLLRSAIALGARKKATLVSLGIHRRMQTVYHPHSPEFAGKILAVKELVRVEKTPTLIALCQPLQVDVCGCGASHSLLFSKLARTAIIEVCSWLTVV